MGAILSELPFKEVMWLCPDCGERKASPKNSRCLKCATALKKKEMKTPTYSHCTLCGKEKRFTQRQAPRCAPCKAACQEFLPKWGNCEDCGSPKETNNQRKFARCYECSQKERLSATEDEVTSFMEEVAGESAVRRDRAILAGRELDVVFPSLGVAVEYNGDYWHSEERYRPTRLHPTVEEWQKSKIAEAAAAGLALGVVWEWDWKHQREAVKEALITLVLEGRLTPILQQLVTPDHRLRKE